MLRRSGHSDERRRRVLMEDPAASGDPAAPKTTAQRKAKQRSYSDAAHVDNLAPITCVMPQRAWSLSVLLLLGLTLIALANFLHVQLPLFAKYAGAEQLDSLNFAVRGNFAAWLSSMWLGWAGLMSMQIYNLRRHRHDDYKARYRVWIWASIILMGASLDAATGWHDVIGGLLAVNVKQLAPLGTTVCWVLAASLIISMVAMRMAIEIRRSSGSVLSLVLAMLCYVAAVGVRTGWLQVPPDFGWHIMVSATLLGHLFVWFTTLSYGAHVYLDAQGQLHAKKPKKEKPKKKEETSDKPAEVKKETPAITSDKLVSGNKVRVDAAHGSSTTSEAAKTPAKPGGLKGMLSAFTSRSSTPKQEAAAAATSSSSDERRMSKAERKRLRREGRQDQDEEEDED